MLKGDFNANMLRESALKHDVFAFKINRKTDDDLRDWEIFDATDESPLGGGK